MQLSVTGNPVLSEKRLINLHTKVSRYLDSADRADAKTGERLYQDFLAKYRVKDMTSSRNVFKIGSNVYKFEDAEWESQNAFEYKYIEKHGGESYRTNGVNFKIPRSAAYIRGGNWNMLAMKFVPGNTYPCPLCMCVDIDPCCSECYHYLYSELEQEFGLGDIHDENIILSGARTAYIVDLGFSESSF